MEAPDDAELVEQAVQAAIDAGVAVNGEHGVAAARVAARFIVERLASKPDGLREALAAICSCYPKNSNAHKIASAALMDGTRDAGS